jgi:hypothetical protein
MRQIDPCGGLLVRKVTWIKSPLVAIAACNSILGIRITTRNCCLRIGKVRPIVDKRLLPSSYTG